MKTISLLLSVTMFLCVRVCDATLVIAVPNSAHVIDFAAFSGMGFQPTPTAGQLDSDSWAVTGWSDGNLAFGGTQTSGGTDYTRGPTGGPVTTGGMYGYDVDATAGVNRGLGFQPGTSDWAPGTLTLRVQNSTGQTVGSIDLSYVVYVRNDQERGNSFNFSYSTDDVSYTAVASLDLTSPAASDGAGLVPNNRSTTLMDLSIADGSFLYLRWSGADVSGSGFRDEFVLDDISITAVPVPEPAHYGLLSAFGLILLGGLRFWGGYRTPMQKRYAPA